MLAFTFDLCRYDTGQLAPMKCIRTARTVQSMTDMADDIAASLKVNGWATADFITSDAVTVGGAVTS